MGREDAPHQHNEGSHENSEGHDHPSDTFSEASSQKLHMAEKDDDSPYFVKIVIDTLFLSHLEDPNLIDPLEIIDEPERCQVLMENQIFIDIVTKEVQAMFFKKKVRGDSSSNHSKPLSKFNPTKKEEILNIPDVINEESSITNSAENRNNVIIDSLDTTKFADRKATIDSPGKAKSPISIHESVQKSSPRLTSIDLHKQVTEIG